MSQGASGQLNDAQKSLEQLWMQTRQDWNDPVSREIEEQFVVPLLNDLRHALSATSQLNEVMAKVRRDCEE